MADNISVSLFRLSNVLFPKCYQSVALFQGDKLDGCVSSKEEKPLTNLKVELVNEDKEIKESPKEDKEKKDSTEEDKNNNEPEDGEEHEPELYFTPKVHLPIVIINTMEDNEDVVVEL